MPVSPPTCDFGRRAPPFALPGTDNRTRTLDDIRGERGTLVMFICNHCPYVLAVLDRILRDTRDLQALGIGVAAICANDAAAYPQDSFENMKTLAEDRASPSPISTTRARRSPAPTGPPAPRISSASTPPSGCNTVAVSMPRAGRGRRRTRAVTSSRR